MARIALPRIWVEDAQSRDLDIGVEVRTAGNLVTLNMTDAQVAEALSAADYDLEYQSYDSFDDPTGHLRKVAASAARTIARLNEWNRQQGSPTQSGL